MIGFGLGFSIGFGGGSGIGGSGSGATSGAMNSTNSGFAPLVIGSDRARLRIAQVASRCTPITNARLPLRRTRSLPKE